MRLIDADALKKAIIKHLCVKSENNLFPSEKSIYNCIDEQPTIELLKAQQEQKEKWIRDIDLYIADAEDSAKNPVVRSAKGYAVGLSYGLNIAKEIIEGKRNHG